ncbi:WUSCHEL-related homeobox 11-like [Senna tora]|uniref:WUSCHEL-related homeobox 11-like n=1 Tax=Senna tora TaxID=362788 RepID=A0A834WE26_9FABA|nr:WUSCHEL-related homeobox 11-like [Senna tora]
MEDQREGEGQQEEVHRNRSVRHGPTTERSGNNSEPVRSRWTPKPEQILILESIFNSGMVNPPKEETVRIRKLLEKFGSVGDANVFYWFQNRRSRSRRRQRQMQAASAQLDPPTTQLQPHHQLGLGLGAAIPFQYDANNSASMPMNMMPYSASFPTHLSASGGSSSDSCANDNNMTDHSVHQWGGNRSSQRTHGLQNNVWARRRSSSFLWNPTSNQRLWFLDAHLAAWRKLLSRSKANINIS